MRTLNGLAVNKLLAWRDYWAVEEDFLISCGTAVERMEEILKGDIPKHHNRFSLDAASLKQVRALYRRKLREEFKALGMTEVILDTGTGCYYQDYMTRSGRKVSEVVGLANWELVPFKFHALKF